MRATILLAVIILSGCQTQVAKQEPRSHVVAMDAEWKRYKIGKTPVLISPNEFHETRVVYLVNESQSLISIGGRELKTIFDGIGIFGVSAAYQEGGRLQAITASEIYAVAWKEGSIIATKEHPFIEQEQTKKRKTRPGVVLVGI